MKRLFSVLMVAVVATMTFAFTTPKTLGDVFYNKTLTGWANGPGSSCSTSGNVCDISFDEDFDDYADQIKAQIADQPAGTFDVFIDLVDDNPDAGQTIPVSVTLTRKN